MPAAASAIESPWRHAVVALGVDEPDTARDLVRAVCASLDRDLVHRTTVSQTDANSPTVGLRICFVTPFAWSQPHEVNAHVDGAARRCAGSGHEVTVLAPSSRAATSSPGGARSSAAPTREVIAVGPSIPISRRTTHGRARSAVRANLRLALDEGRFDVVHGFEPGLPSLSYLALTSTDALTAATFFSPERLGYPARRSRRDRLAHPRRRAPRDVGGRPPRRRSERFEGDYRLVPLGVDTRLFHAACRSAT